MWWMDILSMGYDTCSSERKLPSTKVHPLHQLSYAHRKEYVRWVMEAKKPETRDRRLHKTIEMLLEGKKGI